MDGTGFGGFCHRRHHRLYGYAFTRRRDADGCRECDQRNLYGFGERHSLYADSGSHQQRRQFRRRNRFRVHSCRSDCAERAGHWDCRAFRQRTGDDYLYAAFAFDGHYGLHGNVYARQPDRDGIGRKRNKHQCGWLDKWHILHVHGSRDKWGRQLGRVGGFQLGRNLSATVYDSFNRANQSLNATTTENGAKTWSVTRLDNTASPISAAGVVIASKAVNDSGSFSSGEHWFANVDTGATTMDVSVTLKSLGAHPEYGQLQAKWLDNTDYILMQVNNSDTSASNYYLGYRQGATYTALNGSIAVTPADGDVLRVVVSGTTVTAYINGSVVYGPTAVSAISYLSSATKAGFSAITTTYQSTVVFYDFKVA